MLLMARQSTHILGPKITGTVHGDGSRAKEGSVDPLEVPLGPMTRARAKRFKEALHVLIRDAHVEEARVKTEGTE